MRLNSKLKAACLAGVAVVTTLAAGEALAGGRGGGGGRGGWSGGWAGGGHAIGRPAVGDRVGVGHRASGSPFASGYALNRAYHGRYGGYGGYGGGGGDYWGGYYGGGGVYYGDTGYGYGYGDNYATGVPAAYSALTYPSSYQGIYQVPTTICQPAARTNYVPATTYQANQHIIYLPAQ